MNLTTLRWATGLAALSLSLILAACSGEDTQSAVETAVAQTQELSGLQTAAAGGGTSNAPLGEPSVQIATDSASSGGSLPFEGLWISGSDDLSQLDNGNVEAPQPYELLAITSRTLYWIRGSADGGVSEELYEIVSFDLQNNHITLLKRWIRHNGVPFGFDYNPWLLTYNIQDNQLWLTIAGESEFPAEATSGPYYRR